MLVIPKMAHCYNTDVAHYSELHADVAHCYGTLLRHPWHTTTHGCDTLLQAALAHSGTLLAQPSSEKLTGTLCLKQFAP